MASSVDGRPEGEQRDDAAVERIGARPRSVALARGQNRPAAISSAGSRKPN